MHAEDRHQAILRRVRDRGSLRVSDFAAELGVSPVTVRRDVEALATRGLVARVHGGATLPEKAVPTGSQAVPAPQARDSGQVYGMLVPDTHYYYPEVIKGAREVAAARGVRLILGISGYDPTEEQVQARQLLDAGVDGLLVTPCGSAAQSRWMSELTIPLVLLERRPDDDGGVERVVSDHVNGAQLAVRHLISSGRKQIALVLREQSPHAHWIKEGYLAELRASGHQANENLFFPTSAPDMTDARQLADFLQAVEDRRIDGVLVHNDHDAIMLLQRLRSRGLSVPEDLAMVAYDDDLAALADIPLTAVAPPKQAVGAAAVDLLAARIANPERPRHRLTILPELHIRASSG